MDATQVLRIDPEERVTLKIRDLSVTVKQKAGNTKDTEQARGKTKILDGVSFDLEAGQMLAVMGGSGSGKTTLLNTLSQRLNFRNKSLGFSGSIEYISGNGSNSKSKIKNSYLQQTDVFLPGLTVLETLKYQADLRLPHSATKSQKTDLISSLLLVLGLDQRQNDIVMSFTGGINLSGGEQRRLSLAIQLLNKPSCLFLDEPTTGLDTSTSLKLVQALKTLASPVFGITIILSIHQPRVEITKLFDKICLLTKGGRLVFYGSLVDSCHYFNSISHKCGDNFSSYGVNVVDYIMSLSVKDTTSKARELITTRKIDMLVENWRNHSSYPPCELSTKEMQSKFRSNLEKFSRSKKESIPFWKEVEVLTRRSFVISYRDVKSLITLIGGAIFLALMSGWMFYKPRPDLAGIRSLTSCLYVMLEVIGFSPMLIEIERLWTFEGTFFFREYRERYVSIWGFIISRRLSKLLLEDLPISVPFASITYFMWGLRTAQEAGESGIDGHWYGVYLAITILSILIGMSSAMTCFAVAPDFSFSIAASNVWYQIQNSACGYFVNAATMPVYVRWTKYLAFFWYGFGALSANQYTNWTGDCPYEKGSQECVEYTGNYQLAVLGFPQNWVAEPIGILICWFVGVNIITSFCLYFRKYDVNVAKTKTNKIGKGQEVTEENQKTSDFEEELNPYPTPFAKEEAQHQLSSSSTVTAKPESESINICIHNIQLSVKLKSNSNPFSRTKQDRLLLDDIDAVFKANDVNAIMGPSGSGKTTLLNFLASRLPKTSSFSSSGSIKINDNQVVTPRKLSKIAGFVTQSDSYLIPHLTVRETLFFQAKLRLPMEEHTQIPTIIGQLIRQTGLVDCAETLVGSESMKGISGGEKRRVSIAIQLLGKPKILFLDEPTSGLDSTTAYSILSLLHNLSRLNKTTVIMTIHQPSEEMFAEFGTVLLMAKGGKVIYDGLAGSIRNYLTSAGFAAPNQVNIADYMLDLISAGIDESKEESEAKVSRLIQNWKVSHPKPDAMLVQQEDQSKFIALHKYYNVQLPFGHTFRTIAKRSMITTFRASDILFARAGQVTLLAIVHALYFAPLKNSPEGISNRLGLVQEVLNLYFVGFVNNMALYPIERGVFYHEYRDNIYGVLEFNFSYLLNEVPIEAITSLFFSALLVFAVGLPRTAGMFFTMFFASFVSINAGDSLGILFNSLFNHMGLAMNLLCNILILAIFMGGTMSLHMPPFFQAWNWLNPMKYAVGVCAKLGFSGQEFSCGEGVTSCSMNSGQKVLDYYNLDVNFGGYIGGLAACLIIYRAIAITFVYVRVKWLN